jgi:Uma2 family endonuclease
MASVAQLITAQQLAETPEWERFELVRGELVPMPLRGFQHGAIVAEITVALQNFVHIKKLGAVTISTGFWIARDPDTVRGPDVAFIRAERIPTEEIRTYFPGPPDLAVEVLSPGDHAGEVNAKIQDWLIAGCTEVWVVDPDTRSVTVYSHLRQAKILSVADTLTSEELLPGFRLPIAQVFAN